MRVFPTPEALAVGAADRIVEILAAAIRERGTAFVALAGGSTPRATYRELALRRAALDFGAVEFFWSDERVVSPEDPASNVRLAREGLLDPLGVDPARVHPPRTELGASDAAVNYEIALRTAFGSPTPVFDLVLLGMGDDGHTASLFPGGPELDVPSSCLVVASHASVPPHERVSFTLPLIDAARCVVFLVAGEGKAAALARVRAGDPSLPAARVKAANVEWLADAAAAGETRHSA